MERRAVLIAGSGLLAGLAGCVGNDSPSNEPEGSPQGTETETEEELCRAAPTVQFEYDGEPGEVYQVIHAGGDDFEGKNVEIRFVDVDGEEHQQQWGSGVVTAGGGVETEAAVKAGSEIIVFWPAPSGCETDSQIGYYLVPE